ncbi:nicotinate (nicotinamide) nucleotide adenylyltransferase [Oscillospiraceae bacterium CM]|nr:nicotinate (nicotinamide) nucleotide adenylyltransferase [Oscillospiraceae bacterium CM]
MRLGIFGGTFNPPHLGHIKAASDAAMQLALDRLLIIPAGTPPHKDLPHGTPTAAMRLEMARLSFGGLDSAEVSDIELRQDGVSYTAETVTKLKAHYPGDALFLLMGTDMFLTLEGWKDPEKLLRAVTPAVFSRCAGDTEKIDACAGRLAQKYQVDTQIVQNKALDISSTTLRQALKNRGGVTWLEDKTYAYIIKNKLYGARADFNWLRERAFSMMKPKRIPHTVGCEFEAVKLARRWGENENDAREAAILHDITKYLDLQAQLHLCEKYDIMIDTVERAEVKLLHAKTGAAIAYSDFGAPENVKDAIFWHTTGRADMSLLEKIIYIADYIEPTRDFDGVDDLRALAYDDLDKAVLKGLEMSIDDMRRRGIIPHQRTQEAVDSFRAFVLHNERD